MAAADIVLSVNQQLAFVRVQIEAAKKHQSESSIQSRLSIHAHLDASLYHLEKAMTLFLGEIAAQSGQDQLKVLNEAGNVIAGVKSLQQSDFKSAELDEWSQLISQSNSWLNHCLTARVNPSFIAQQFAESENVDQDTLDQDQISSLIISMKSEEARPLEEVSGWLQLLQNLIDRQRERLVES